MKIAVTYDNGEIFQHFGKTESFKVYEVEDNKVVSSEVIGSNGTGHGALAGLLAEQGVNVLICGGIGGGAQTALRTVLSLPTKKAVFFFHIRNGKQIFIFHVFRIWRKKFQISTASIFICFLSMISVSI